MLKALEEAPRFREAHRLLLEIVDRAGRRSARARRLPEPDTEPAAEQNVEKATLIMRVVLCWPWRYDRRGRGVAWLSGEAAVGTATIPTAAACPTGWACPSGRTIPSSRRTSSRSCGSRIRRTGAATRRQAARRGLADRLAGQRPELLLPLAAADVAEGESGAEASCALTDPELFDYPFIYIVEPGALVFNDAEVKALRRYLLNGGFLMVDDFWGEDEWYNFYCEISACFPTASRMELPLEHPIFHCVYDLKKKPQIPSIGHAVGRALRGPHLGTLRRRRRPTTRRSSTTTAG